MLDDRTPEPPDPNAGDEPLDADLVAYLDGELDEPQARAVEDRLLTDSATRAQAAAYKKTFDLLDYLPKPEPSPDFATRTLTRIQPTMPASLSGSAPARKTIPVPSSTTGIAAVVAPTSRRPWWVGTLTWALVAAACLGGGYGVHAGLQPILEPPPKETDDLALTDIRVIESLPLYMGVDDLDYLRKLDDPDLFALDPATPPQPRGEAVPVGNRAKLIEIFKGFPPTRQQQLRQLDQQFHELPAEEQDRLGRVLEAYAVWLNRLSESDHRRILTASNPAERLDVVRTTKEKLWQDGLPQRHKDQLKVVAGDPETKVLLIEHWKQADRVRREEWGLARRQWDTMQGGAKYWPFSDPVLAKQVDDYLKTVLKVDLAKEPKWEQSGSIRVSRDEYFELKARHEAATKDGFWLFYGAMVYRLSLIHPGLPEPGDKAPPTELAHLGDLPKELRKKGINPQLEKRFSRGKWPEFALDITDTARKLNIPLDPLGPSKPGAFQEPVNQFLAELQPKLSIPQRERLKRDEGKWPEYPRTMIELAKDHDLPVPGVTLPGSPKLWQQNYSLGSGKKK